MVHIAILRCTDDQQYWIKCLDSIPFLLFSVHCTKQTGTGMSLRMMVYDCDPMIPFKLVDIEAIPIQAPMKENTESAREDSQAVSVI